MRNYYILSLHARMAMTKLFTNYGLTVVALFEIALGLCFLMSKKKDNIVETRQYMEIFSSRFVQEMLLDCFGIGIS